MSVQMPSLGDPACLPLTDDVVHVWHVTVSALQPCLSAFMAVLPSDEWGRAAQFAAARDQRRFIARRGWLRSVLGRYLGVSAAVVRLAYSALGKPQLLPGAHPRTLQFSVTSADEHIWLAVTATTPLGIDGERIDAQVAWEPIARRFFTRAEHRLIAAAAPLDQPAIFFRYWTSKEAYIKAWGGSISALPEVSVAMQPRSTASMPTMPDGMLTHVMPLPGYMATVALLGATRPVQCWQWTQP
jgi:4'-phosphopantetheinyl transferase